MGKCEHGLTARECFVCASPKHGPSAPQEAARTPARQLVDRQAEDEGLWFAAATAPEAYLQKALRALHAAVEAQEAAPSAPTAQMEAARAYEIADEAMFELLMSEAIGAREGDLLRIPASARDEVEYALKWLAPRGCVTLAGGDGEGGAYVRVLREPGAQA